MLKLHKLSKWNKLFVSIILDLIGILSLSLGLIGDVLDVPYSFLYGYFAFLLYGDMNIALAGWAKEILPIWTDYLPVLTLVSLWRIIKK